MTSKPPISGMRKQGSRLEISAWSSIDNICPLSLAGDQLGQGSCMYLWSGMHFCEAKFQRRRSPFFNEFSIRFITSGARSYQPPPSRYDEAMLR